MAIKSVKNTRESKILSCVRPLCFPHPPLQPRFREISQSRVVSKGCSDFIVIFHELERFSSELCVQRATRRRDAFSFGGGVGIFAAPLERNDETRIFVHTRMSSHFKHTLRSDDTGHSETQHVCLTKK